MYLLDSAHVLHVAKTGNDGNSGHAGQYPVNLANDAKLTIGAAVSAAAAGDTIVIWPGDYAENVDASAKPLNFVGTSRNHSKIVKTTGTALKVDDDSVVKNLSVEALQLTSDGKAFDCSHKTNIVVKNCDLYGGYDGLYGYNAKSVFLRNCRIRGKYDGGNLGGAERVVAEGCIFMGLGTYGTGVDCRGLNGVGIGSYSNSIFIAERADTTNREIMAACVSVNDVAVFKNCVLKATAGTGHTGGAYGILVNGSSAVAALENCIASCESENASDGPYDLRQAIGKLVVSNCAYSTYQGTVTNGSPKMNKALKLLVNKAIQTKATGKIDYYDDDGSTVLFFHTPTDGEATITRTPSL